MHLRRQVENQIFINANTLEIHIFTLRITKYKQDCEETEYARVYMDFQLYT